MQVKHLMDEYSNFFSFAAFQTKYNLQVRPATSNLLWINLSSQSSMETKHQRRYLKFVMSQRLSKFICQEIVSKNCERPISYQEKCAKTSIFPQRKLLILEGRLPNILSFAQKAVILSFSTWNNIIVVSPVTNSLFLKKSWT